MKDVVKELRSRRIAAGVTISELAKRMDTEPARISQIEHGHVGLTLKRLYAYAAALGLSVTIKLEKQ